LADLAKALSDLAGAEEEEVDRPAHQIAAVAQLLARADTFVRLAGEQATLAKLLRRFADKGVELSRPEQLEVQELAYQQRRIQGALRALLDALPEALARLPDESEFDDLKADVNDFLRAVADAKIQEDLAESAKTLERPDARAGWMLALQAADKMDRLISKCSGLPGKGEKALRFKPSMQKGLGGTLQQILAAMNSGTGSGKGGRDGYSLFNDEMALYGPEVPLTGEQAGGRSEKAVAGAARSESMPGQTNEPGLKPASTAGRVRLQPDAKFPLRYRELVGEYFRVIAESDAERAGDRPPTQANP
jgi:hypothetical protein